MYNFDAEKKSSGKSHLKQSHKNIGIKDADTAFVLVLINISLKYSTIAMPASTVGIFGRKVASMCLRSLAAEPGPAEVQERATRLSFNCQRMNAVHLKLSKIAVVLSLATSLLCIGSARSLALPGFNFSSLVVYNEFPKRIIVFLFALKL